MLAFDADHPGQIAAMSAADKGVSAAFADGQDGRHNGNWAKVEYQDPYLEYQSLLLDLGVGLKLPSPKENAAGELDWYAKNPTVVRAWPIPRLVAALANWHAVIESALFYGNAYQIQFVIPHADQRIKELRAELARRATPKVMASSPAKDVKGWWDVKTVREKVDPFDIFGQFLPDMEQKGKDQRATCPFHKQRSTGKAHTPSLYLYTDSGTYKCFACQASGSMFDFVMALEQIPFAEAVNRVAQLGNL